MAIPYSLVVILSIVFLIVLLISGFYVTRAAVKTKRIPGYSNDPGLQSAHKKVTDGAIVTWISVTLLVVLIICLIYFKVETAGYTGARKGGGAHPFLMLFMFICGGLGLLNGILAASAGAEIKRSANYDPSNSDAVDAHEACVVAAVTGIGSIGILLLYFLCNMIYVHQVKKEEAEKVAKRKDAEANLIAEQVKHKREVADTDKAFAELNAENKPATPTANVYINTASTPPVTQTVTPTTSDITAPK